MILLALSALVTALSSRAWSFEDALAIEEPQRSLALEERPLGGDQPSGRESVRSISWDHLEPTAIGESLENRLRDEPQVGPSLPTTIIGPDESTGLSTASIDGATTWDSSSRTRSDRVGGERLIDRATDPTSWLLEFRFREQWNWPVGASGPDTQAFEL